MNKFILEYDLNLQMNPAMGQLIFSADGTIRAEENGEEKFSFPAHDIKEAKVQPGIGCGLVFVKYDRGEGDLSPCRGVGTESPRPCSTPDRVLCRFSMSGLKQAGEFCKIVNYYIQTGEAAFPEEAEKVICEKCGRPLPEEISVCVFCYNKFSVIKRALGFLKPYAKTVTLSQIFNALTLAAFLVPPIIMQQLIDRHLEPQGGIPYGTWAQILVFAGALLLSRIFGEGVTIIAARRFNRATISVMADMRAEVYEKLQSHSMTLFAKRTPGDLIRRIMDDTDTVGEFLTDLARWVLEMILMFTIAAVILFFTDWRLTLLILIPVPLVALILWAFQKILHARFERQWRKSSRVNSILHDIIKGIRTVKSFGNEKREIEKFSRANRDLAEISSQNEVLWGLMFPPMGFLIGMGEFLILFVGGWMVLNGSISLGVMVLFTMYLWAIYEPLRWLVNVPRWMANTTTSMVKVFELLDEESEMKENAKPQNVPIAGKVAYENVHFGYKSYEPVLKGINLEIQPGEMIGLVGKSGVGKSTLINLAMRLYDPNNGRVTINETNIRKMSPTHLHENMGVVFQDSFLFAGTFFENIAYGKHGATLEEVIAAAQAANAHDFITQSPDGYNTLIGEGGQSLSGGERQRLAIARAIIKNPDILILDEATSSLDVETEAIIQDSLSRITKGRTTIAIAHRLSTLRNADRLVVLSKEAGVAEVGTHSELLKKKGIYYDLVMAQRKSSRDC
ncbi:MAG: ABC transporter ATP-binding protein/permease [Defluviitaleaceae bacterium]|nr:ABC transporter ATP-binding protein/permease [Defluviitaleaceae bacterium]MCL2263130.1 ABC transporter ATP-binding protein/permease [Defluviitaleaceae bacterium]